MSAVSIRLHVRWWYVGAPRLATTWLPQRLEHVPQALTAMSRV